MTQQIKQLSANTLFFFLLLTSLSLYGQKEEVRFHRLSIENGLSQSSVHSIFQDSVGYLWFGTKDGLNKYDGYDFTIYRNDPADSTRITSNSVSYIYQDRKANLWVGTVGGGLNKFNYGDETFESYFYSSSNPTQFNFLYITQIHEGRDGLLWIATRQTGLIQFDPNTGAYKLYRHEPDDSTTLSSDNLTFAFEDKQGRIWVGTDDHGVCRLDRETGRFKRFRYNAKDPHSISEDRSRSYYQFPTGEIWIGTHRGINKYRESTNDFERYRPEYTNGVSIPDSIDTPVTNIFSKDAGKMWLSVHAVGVCELNLKTNKCSFFLHRARDPNSLSSNTISSMFKDRSDNLWIGTNGGGANKLSTEDNFNLYRNDPEDPYSLTDNSVRAVLEDDEGQLYIGSYGGLSIFNREKRTYRHFTDNRFEPDRNLANMAVYTLLLDHKNNLWIGLEGTGLQIYRPGEDRFDYFSMQYTSSNLSDDLVYSLYEDSKQRIWVGTEKGLNLYLGGNRFENYFYNADERQGETIRQILEEDENHLWLATDRGLILLNIHSKEYKRFLYDQGDSNSISNNKVKCLYKDRIGALWIGTDGGGLNKLQYERDDLTFGQFEFTIYSKASVGLPNDVVYGILEDDKNHLWLSTNNGLCSFNKLDQKVKQYTVTDGLQSNEFNSGAYYKSPSGEMFFGGINGLNAFFPDRISVNKHIPRVVISDFEIFNKPAKLPQHISQTSAITLPYTDNFISFEFAALDYTAPEKNQFAYKMEGVDNEWIYSNNRRFASYTNLGPGKYIFRVKASNNDGIWNEEGTSVTLVITPSFWDTIWFKILIFAAILMLVSLLIWRRTMDVRKKQTFLEEQVQLKAQQLQNERLQYEVAISKAVIEGQNMEQRRISEDLHDGLGQTLTAANLNLSMLENELEDKAVRNSHFENLKNLLNNAILDVRNISHNLMPDLLEAEGLEAALDELCKRSSKTSYLNINLEITSLPRRLPIGTEFSLYRIVQEIISNTLKHANARNLSIELKENRGNLTLMTKDDGIGFDFRPPEKRLPGMGLSNIAARVELLKGKYELHTAPGKGTSIHITIPLQEKVKD